MFRRPCSVRLAGAGPLRTRIGGYILNTTSHVRASRTAAALGTVMAAAALALGAAGPAQAACTYTVINGVNVCVPDSTGGTAGGGTVVVGGGGSTVPGGAAPIVGGNGGAPLHPAPYAPAPAPYVPPAPVYASAPVQAYVPPAPAPVTNQPVKGFAPAEPSQPVKGVAPAENPVIDGVPAVAPAAEATPTESSSVAPPTPSGTATAMPSGTPSLSTAPAAEPIQSERTADADNGTAPGFVAGSLGVLVVAAAAVFYRRRLLAARNRRAK